MKQLEIIDQEIILKILKFHEDIGINFNINQFEIELNADLLANIKQNSKKKLENTITIQEKQKEEILNSSDEIDVLENSFKNYNGCALKKTATNFIKFQGSKNADLLFIDGTPDKEEDKAGKSFVSAKGDLFEKMLNAIDLNKDDIFIVNAIPWRPPGNRYPTEEEIKICRPFIFNLIKILKPKIIVCLGEISTNQILDLKHSVVKTRGKWHFLKSNPINDFDSEYSPYVLPTLNISYLLARPDMKRQAWEDMKLLRDKIREI